MARADFTAKIKDRLATAAGHQCSFPTCNQRTEGPGHTSDFVSKSGYAAHIYAASSGGPRGQVGLSSSELRSPENGIWLCGRHAKIIDNNKGAAYPPETLLSYKALHEARVSLEHEGLYPPVGWLHEVNIVDGPVFANPQNFQLAKLNLFYGDNGTGKTAITEWICGLFDCTKLDRWMPAQQFSIDMRLSFLNPNLQTLRVVAKESEIRYSIDGRPVAFIPTRITIFRPAALDFSIGDDAEILAQAVGVPVPTIFSLIDEVNNFQYAKVQNLRFERDVDENGDLLEQWRLFSDVDGTVPGLPFRNLSGREAERVLLELATAAARLSGKYCPTLLILDQCVGIIFKGFFDFYSRHLLDPLNQFQTIMCIASRHLDLDAIRWNGWQVIRTHGRSPRVSLHQDIRVPEGRGRP